MGENVTVFALGIDLGGTKIRAGLMRQDGTLERVLECQTLAHRGPDAVIADMAALMQDVIRDVARDQIRGIGIGSPGPLDVTTGIVESPHNLPGFAHVPLANRIESMMQIPTVLDNDANVAALAEYRYGDGQGIQNMVYVTISTGIGGGIIENGQVVRGRRGMAGEFGHISIDALHGNPCICGNRGCLEAIASGPAIAKTASDRLARDVTTKEVGELAQQGDPVALAVLHEAFDALGAGIVNLLHIFDPERVILGGGVTQMGPGLLDHVRNYVTAHVMPPYRDVTVNYAKLKQDVGVIGAACLIL